MRLRSMSTCSTNEAAKGAAGMPHQSKNIAVTIANASDVFNRTVRICFRDDAALAVRVAQNDLSIFVQFAQRFRIGIETTFAMCDRQPQQRSFRQTVCERRIRDLYARR